MRTNEDGTDKTLQEQEAKAKTPSMAVVCAGGALLGVAVACTLGGGILGIALISAVTAAYLHAKCKEDDAVKEKTLELNAVNIDVSVKHSGTGVNFGRARGVYTSKAQTPTEAHVQPHDPMKGVEPNIINCIDKHMHKMSENDQKALIKFIRDNSRDTKHCNEVLGSYFLKLDHGDVSAKKGFKTFLEEQDRSQRHPHRP